MALFDVIKYEGNGDTLVYRYPTEDFNTGSQLILQQSQEAFFYYRGTLLAHFTDPGHYTLNTENIPLLSKLINLPFGKESPFTATVYFVDKTERPNVKWGVGDINFIDKEFGVPLSLGLCGVYSYKISNPMRFIEKILGTLKEYKNADLSDLLEKLILQGIKNFMSNYLKQYEVDLLTIQSEFVNFSENMKPILNRYFNEYGFELNQLVITDVAKNEDSEEYKRWYRLKTQDIQIKEIETNKRLSGEKKAAEIELAAIDQQGKIDLEKQRRAGELSLIDYDLELERKKAETAKAIELSIKKQEAAANVEIAEKEAEAKRITERTNADIASYTTREMGKAEAESLRAAGIAQGDVYAAQGTSADKQRTYDVATALANNTGSGGLMSTGVGLGMMGAGVNTGNMFAGGIFNGLLNPLVSDIQNMKTEQTPANSTFNPLTVGNTGFGPDDDAPETITDNSDVVSKASDISENNSAERREKRLRELKKYFDEGLITEEEFTKAKTEILNSLK